MHTLFGHMVYCISLLMVSAARYLSKTSAVPSTHITFPAGATNGPALCNGSVQDEEEVMAGMDSVMNCVVDSTFCFIWFQSAEVGVIAVVLPRCYSPVCNAKL